MTERQILNYLDQCEFPLLDNGYYYHADQEMKIYRKGEDWIIVLQVLQYNNHDLSVGGFSTIVYKYGSDISVDDVYGEGVFFHLAKDEEVETFVKEGESFASYLNPDATCFRVKEFLIPIEQDRAEYEKRGIVLEAKDKMRPWEVLRYLAPEYSSNFWVCREDLEIAKGYIEEIKLSKWEHPDGFETGFNDMCSFQEIARCLANNLNIDKSKIETEESNTHWSNWPAGGTL